MANQYAESVLNALLEALEVDVGVSPQLAFFTGAKPANCAAANSGTELSRMTLPSDWSSAAASAVKSKLGTWQDLPITTSSPGTCRKFGRSRARS